MDYKNMSADYLSGYWRALNRVIALLQTYDSNQLDRKELYKVIHDMRPE